MKRLFNSVLFLAALALSFTTYAADSSASFPEEIKLQEGSILLTIFLKHDQSKPLAEINKQLTQQDFFKRFPPKGIKVVSWYVMMGIGQVVTLEVPAARLREVNRAIEDTAWGGFHTEFYPTYDYAPIARQIQVHALDASQ